MNNDQDQYQIIKTLEDSDQQNMLLAVENTDAKKHLVINTLEKSSWITPDFIKKYKTHASNIIDIQENESQVMIQSTYNDIPLLMDYIEEHSVDFEERLRLGKSFLSKLTSYHIFDSPLQKVFISLDQMTIKNDLLIFKDYIYVHRIDSTFTHADMVSDVGGILREILKLDHIDPQADLSSMALFLDQLQDKSLDFPDYDSLYNHFKVLAAMVENTNSRGFKDLKVDHKPQLPIEGPLNISDSILSVLSDVIEPPSKTPVKEDDLDGLMTDDVFSAWMDKDFDLVEPQAEMTPAAEALVEDEVIHMTEDIAPAKEADLSSPQAGPPGQTTEEASAQKDVKALLHALAQEPKEVTTIKGPLYEVPDFTQEDSLKHPLEVEPPKEHLVPPPKEGGDLESLQEEPKYSDEAIERILNTTPKNIEVVEIKDQTKKAKRGYYLPSFLAFFFILLTITSLLLYYSTTYL